MELTLFNDLLDFVSSDIVYTMLFFLAFVGFFVAILVNSTKRGKPYRRNTFFMVWGSISTLIILAVVLIIGIDLFNIIAG